MQPVAVGVGDRLLFAVPQATPPASRARVNCLVNESVWERLTGEQLRGRRRDDLEVVYLDAAMDSTWADEATMPLPISHCQSSEAR